VSFQTKKQEYLLDVATRMYVRDDAYLRPRFSKILQSFYNASIQKIDFEQSRNAVQAVNSWVSEATHGKIKSMFSEGKNMSSVLQLHSGQGKNEHAMWEIKSSAETRNVTEW
jgi:serine protease inhibitor